MAGIHIRELYFRVTSRPEILPADLRAALMEAGIAVCRESNLLKQTAFATLPAGASRLVVPTPAHHDLNRVDQVFFRDPLHPGQDWVELHEIAPVYRERQHLHVESQEPAPPSDWGLRGSILRFQAPADAAYPLRIEYSWSPTRASQPETFDLPSDAEEAMIAYARWILLQDRDPKAADTAKNDFDSRVAGLRAAGETGESGVRSIFDFLPYEG